MATCPRCHGALTDDHRCARGMGFYIRSAVRETTTVLIGGTVGVILSTAFQENGPLAFKAIFFLMGALLAVVTRNTMDF